jgi:hypothetical protein
MTRVGSKYLYSSRELIFKLKTPAAPRCCSGSQSIYLLLFFTPYDS